MHAFINLSRHIEDFAFSLQERSSAKGGRALTTDQLSPLHSPMEKLGIALGRQPVYIIMSMVWSLLCRRVFSPFLFTLGPCHREANKLFGEFSQQLRKCSPQREAAWRQRVLYTAYKSAYTKQSVKKVAGSMVKEIVKLVECLTLGSACKGIVDRVHEIVRIAAETWRYTRYLPFAVMPQLDMPS